MATVRRSTARESDYVINACDVTAPKSELTVNHQVIVVRGVGEQELRVAGLLLLGERQLDHEGLEGLQGARATGAVDKVKLGN